MVQFDDVALLFSDELSHLHQLARFVGKNGGYGKDTVSLNQAELHDGGHGDDVHVAAAQDRDNLFILHVHVPQGCDSQKAGIFHNHLVIFHYIQKGYDQLVIGDCDNIVQIFLNIGENLFSRRLDGCTVCNGVDRGKRRHFFILQGYLHTVGACRLYADHLDIGVQHFGQGRDSGTESASADGNENVIYERKLLYDLHGNGSLSGGHRQIIEGMDKSVTMFLGQSVRMLTGFIVDVAVKYHLSAVALGALYFHQGSRRRHDDDCFCAVSLRRVGHALGMVSGRSRNQSLCPLFIGQRADLIIGAANLVGSSHLHVLRLQIDLVSCLLAEILAVQKLCLYGNLFYYLRSFFKFL